MTMGQGAFQRLLSNQTTRPTCAFVTLWLVKLVSKLKKEELLLSSKHAKVQGVRSLGKNGHKNYSSEAEKRLELPVDKQDISLLIFWDPFYYQIWKNIKPTKNLSRVSSFFHSVWKSSKMSHFKHCERSELCLHFWSKMVNLGEFLKNCSLRSDSVTRNVNFNRTKIGQKCQN